MNKFKIYTTDKKILEKVAKKYGLRVTHEIGNIEGVVVGYCWFGNTLSPFVKGSGIDHGNWFWEGITLDPEDFMEETRDVNLSIEDFKIYTTDINILKKVADKYNLDVDYYRVGSPNVVGFRYSSLSNNKLSVFLKKSIVDEDTEMKVLNPEDFMEEKFEYLTKEDFENEEFTVGKHYLDEDGELCKLAYSYKSLHGHVLIGDLVEHCTENKVSCLARDCSPVKTEQERLKEKVRKAVYEATGLSSEEVVDIIAQSLLSGKLDESIDIARQKES